MRLLAGPKASGNGQAAVIHQDAFVYVSELGSGGTVKQGLSPGRYAWVQVARGSVSLNGQTLAEGDGAAVSDERDLSLVGGSPDGAELLYFDLA
jgi:redox-sensitive bicupin YhaK (pirin superfamily)